MTPKQQDTQEDRAESTGPPLQEVSVGIPSKFVTEPFKEVQSNPCQPTPDTPVGWNTHFSRESTALHHFVFRLVIQ